MTGLAIAWPRPRDASPCRAPSAPAAGPLVGAAVHVFDSVTDAYVGRARPRPAGPTASASPAGTYKLYVQPNNPGYADQWYGGPVFASATADQTSAPTRPGTYQPGRRPDHLHPVGHRRPAAGPLVGGCRPCFDSVTNAYVATARPRPAGPTASPSPPGTYKLYVQPYNPAYADQWYGGPALRDATPSAYRRRHRRTIASSVPSPRRAIGQPDAPGLVTRPGALLCAESITSPQGVPMAKVRATTCRARVARAAIVCSSSVVLSAPGSLPVEATRHRRGDRDGIGRAGREPDLRRRASHHDGIVLAGRQPGQRIARAVASADGAGLRRLRAAHRPPSCRRSSAPESQREGHAERRMGRRAVRLERPGVRVLPQRRHRGQHQGSRRPGGAEREGEARPVQAAGERPQPRRTFAGIGDGAVLTRDRDRCLPGGTYLQITNLGLTDEQLAKLMKSAIANRR